MPISQTGRNYPSFASPPVCESALDCLSSLCWERCCLRSSCRHSHRTSVGAGVMAIGSRRHYDAKCVVGILRLLRIRDGGSRNVRRWNISHALLTMSIPVLGAGISQIILLDAGTHAPFLSTVMVGGSVTLILIAAKSVMAIIERSEESTPIYRKAQRTLSVTVVAPFCWLFCAIANCTAGRYMHYSQCCRCSYRLSSACSYGSPRYR